MRVLVTGLSGFIGHHVGEAILKQTDWDLVGLDRLDTTSTQMRLTDIGPWEANKSRVQFVWHDLKSELNEYVQDAIGEVDHIIHLAASTHVDRSITNPMDFVMDNVVGTCNLLQYATRLQSRYGTLGKVVYFSTDEVFGPAPTGVHYAEWDRYRSGNPYAASKAGGEELALAFHNTYRLPVLITHTMNVFGQRQHHEKFIPNTIRKVLQGEKVTIHADQTCTKPGSRYYIHARNVAAAVLFLLDKGTAGEKYNIVGEREVDNLELAQFIAQTLDKRLHGELVDFHSARPGHDLRYALNGDKLRDMGFEYAKTFEVSLADTIRWSVEHPYWLGM
jgi:dTDP-glucose 4,6-dehydratase